MIIKRFKELALVFGLLLITAAFVFIRATNKNRFSETTGNIIETLKHETVFVHPGSFEAAEYLVVEIGENKEKQFTESLAISIDRLTDNDFRNKLESSGKKILLTGDEAQIAKAWVILNQLGVENLFILTEKENPETLRHTFVPDTSKTTLKTE